jgi:enoyl-CoA hydratase/carnithine racemase
MMVYEQILTEVRGRVGIITLNRPEVLNAMTRTMDGEIREQMRAWNEDDGVGAIVLTGAGRAFCSGADISGFEETVRTGTRSGPTANVAGWAEMIRRSKPVVCAINGIAVGQGVTMTLPCDVRIAAEGARLSFRFVRIGLTPELGSSHYLVYLVGLGNTLELMLTGRFVEAEEAYRLGLVNRISPPERMLDDAVELAQEIADNPGWQLQQVKELVHEHYLEHDIGKVVSKESEIFRQSMGTDAHSEALVAFRERRTPRFH